MKKGFTLVELLAVIALLAIIIGFAAPAILERINSERGKIHYVKFKTLVDNDLLDKSILEDYNNYCVKATYVQEHYSFEVVSSCVEG